MSLAHTVYVGPYLLIFKRRRPTSEVRRSCPTVQCEKHKEDIRDQKVKFCPGCGSPIEEVTFPARDSIPFDVPEDTDGELHTILDGYGSELNEKYVISYLEDGPGQSFDPTRELYVSEDITPERIQSDLRKFEQKFSRHIQKIKNVFGESNVKLQWGVLSDIY